MTFQIKTSNDALAPEKQATATFEVLPYSSPTKSYIQIGNINPPAPALAETSFLFFTLCKIQIQVRAIFNFGSHL